MLYLIALLLLLEKRLKINRVVCVRFATVNALILVKSISIFVLPRFDKKKKKPPLANSRRRFSPIRLRVSGTNTYAMSLIFYRHYFWPFQCRRMVFAFDYGRFFFAVISP